jgi:uncharacterized protein (DUF885 family)
VLVVSPTLVAFTFMTAAPTWAGLAHPSSAASVQAPPVTTAAPAARRPASMRAATDARVAPPPADVAAPPSALRELVARYTSDRMALGRRYNGEYSAARRARFRDFHRDWQSRLEAIDFDALDTGGKVDYVLLWNRTGQELRLLEREDRLIQDLSASLPFVPALLDLHDRRRDLEAVKPADAAAVLNRVRAEIEASMRTLEASLAPGSGGIVQDQPQKPGTATPVTTASPAAPRPVGSAAPALPRPAVSKIQALRASEVLTSVQRTVETWFKFYHAYDPLFSWWVAAPYKRVDEGLKSYVKLLRERVIGVRPGEDEPIIGNPLGREALVEDLAFEMIPYTPEELIAIAEREFAWCERELLRASRDMGFGDDWRAAQEKVKTLYVEPGRQPDLIRDLAHEAIAFIEERDLITVPPLAKEVWRVEMMSPERQKVNPFFLGGEVIQVSYPTDTMDHDDKLMSMRGNNPHFSRATVQHELIPGHHLQGFMTERFNPHRRAFGTPFWTEGWALWWELYLWDLEFPRSPEDRIGMLFWRMHRAARIVFSLSFHLGTMTPQQCIDMLVDRVGHERATAEGEVRRSFNGSYSPLYQVAYMMGGLQIRALHRELVGSGRMTPREFHDRILRLGPVPIEMVRALLTETPPARDFRPAWRFDETR